MLTEAVVESESPSQLLDQLRPRVDVYNLCGLSIRADRGLIDAIGGLAREYFAPVALAYDQGTEYAIGHTRLLQREGLWALTGPREFGGLGASLVSYVGVLDELAQWDGAYPNASNMHHVAVYCIAGVGSDEFKARFLPKVIEGGQIIATATSPDSSWSSGARMGEDYTRLEHNGRSGYHLKAKKPYVSLARVADWFMVTSLESGFDSENASEGVISALVPKEEVQIVKVIEPLGNKASDTCAVEIDTFVPDENIIGGRGKVTGSGRLALFGLGYAAVQIGTAKRAFFEGVKMLVRDNEKINNLAIIERVGHVANSIVTAEAQLDQAALSLMIGEKKWATFAISAAKRNCDRLALDTIDEMTLVMGGGSVLTEIKELFGYLQRNAQTVSKMPPNQINCDINCGEISFGKKGVATLRIRKPS